MGFLGFPGGARGKESICQCRRHRHRFDPWVGKTPWRRVWPPTPGFLPGESNGQRSLAGYSPWGRRVGHDVMTAPPTQPLSISTSQDEGSAQRQRRCPLTTDSGG